MIFNYMLIKHFSNTEREKVKHLLGQRISRKTELKDFIFPKI